MGSGSVAPVPLAGRAVDGDVDPGCRVRSQAGSCPPHASGGGWPWLEPGGGGLLVRRPLPWASHGLRGGLQHGRPHSGPSRTPLRHPHPGREPRQWPVHGPAGERPRPLCPGAHPGRVAARSPGTGDDRAGHRAGPGGGGGGAPPPGLLGCAGGILPGCGECRGGAASPGGGGVAGAGGRRPGGDPPRRVRPPCAGGGAGAHGPPRRAGDGVRRRGRGGGGRSGSRSRGESAPPNNYMPSSHPPFFAFPLVFLPASSRANCSTFPKRESALCTPASSSPSWSCRWRLDGL